MNPKEIFVHRLRDLDSVLRAKKKGKLSIYILFRQFLKLFRINEEKISYLIENNRSDLEGFSFHTREKTLDFLFASKYYEPETTKFIKNNSGEIFIDVGAHIGRFALLASKTNKVVCAIEPHPRNFDSLKKNIELNFLRNVLIENCAASDSNRLLFLDEININTGATRINSKGPIETKAWKLDDLAKKKSLSIKKISMILIDVEGYELEVLKGATEILKKGNANLIIECFDLRKIENYLTQFGYSKKKVLDDYNYLFEKSKNL